MEDRRGRIVARGADQHFGVADSATANVMVTPRPMIMRR